MQSTPRVAGSAHRHPEHVSVCGLHCRRAALNLMRTSKVRRELHTTVRRARHHRVHLVSCAWRFSPSSLRSSLRHRRPMPAPVPPARCAKWIRCAGRAEPGGAGAGDRSSRSSRHALAGAFDGANAIHRCGYHSTLALTTMPSVIATVSAKSRAAVANRPRASPRSLARR